jgi:hypothetical protein
MKFRVQITINDPNVTDILTRLGAYRRAIFVREAVQKYIQTQDGQKLIAVLLDRKKKVSPDGKINLDDLL